MNNEVAHGTGYCVLTRGLQAERRVFELHNSKHRYLSVYFAEEWEPHT